MTGQPPRDTDRHRKQRRRRRWGRIVAAAAVIALAVVVLSGFFIALTYLPLAQDAQRTRDELQALADRVQAVGTDVDAATIAGLRTDLATASTDVDRLAAVAHTDRILDVGRLIPAVRDQVDGARAILDAGQLTLRAASSALDLGDRFIAIRGSAPAGGSRVAQVVELMATSGDTVDAMDADLHAAALALASAPAGLLPQLESARTLLVTRLDDVLPTIDSYRDASGILPDMLGWDAPVRYLVLDQSPPELRPTGGFIGSIGIVGLDKGRLSEMSFSDITALDGPNDFPCVTPPPALAGHLLGASCWELADANWSPDFPTSAQDALRLYTNETGDGRISGVLGITPYAIDELLTVTGPIAVPGTDVTIAAGEAMWKTLANTRAAPTPGVDRKAFLGVFAGALIQRVLDLPASRWPDLADALGKVARERDAAAWFAGASPQGLAARWSFDGAVRQDPGDYLFAVDANVSPVSKLNYVTDRSMTDSVTLDRYGNAAHDLAIAWDNRVDAPDSAAYRALPGTGHPILGDYTRILTPDRSRIGEVSGGSFVKLTAPEDAGTEAGRSWWSSYLQVPPGKTSLRYAWTAPYAASFDGTNGVYVLTVQKQPGRQADPVGLSITVPPGASIVETSGGLQVAGRTATLRTTLTQDVVVAVRYVMTP